MTELSQDKTASRMEVVIPITLRGMVKGLTKIFVEYPTDIMAVAADRTERLSQRMMSGRLSAVTMPLGIMLRNSARTVMGTTDRDNMAWWGALSHLGGIGGALTALYFGAQAVAGLLAPTVVGATVGSWGSLVLGGLLAAPVVLPAYGATFVVATTLGAAAVFALSAVPAVANIGVAFKRTIDAWKGIKYDDAVLQPGKSMSDKLRDRRNLSIADKIYKLPAAQQQLVFERLQRQHMTDDAVAVAVAHMRPENQRSLYETLKGKFDKSAAKSGAAAAAAPAPAPRGNRQDV